MSLHLANQAPTANVLSLIYVLYTSYTRLIYVLYTSYICLKSILSTSTLMVRNTVVLVIIGG